LAAIGPDESFWSRVSTDRPGSHEQAIGHTAIGPPRNRLRRFDSRSVATPSPEAETSPDQQVEIGFIVDGEDLGRPVIAVLSSR
jgi:hypothetical protein